jgi:hypothetical protein
LVVATGVSHGDVKSRIEKDMEHRFPGGDLTYGDVSIDTPYELSGGVWEVNFTITKGGDDGGGGDYRASYDYDDSDQTLSYVARLKR